MKLVDLETAKALHELGYDGEYSAWVDPVDASIEHNSSFILDWYIPCPRLDDVAYWIREKYRILIFVRYEEDDDSGTPFDVYFTDMSNDHTRYLSSFPDYEDALECGVKKAIEIIKDRQNNADKA